MSGDAALFREVALETLSWVFDDGFEELELTAIPTGFLWRLWNERARIWISAMPMRVEADASLGPPAPRDKPWTGLAVERAVPLEAVRFVRGLPVIRPFEVYQTDPANPWMTPDERFGVYLAGLADLREHELAGDWSRYDEARAVVPQLHRAWWRGE
jgi:hypothetical protein